MKFIIIILIILLGCTIAAYQGVQPLADTKDKIVNWIEGKTSNVTAPTQTTKTTEPSKTTVKSTNTSIVGKWQYTQQTNQKIEFFKDGRVVFDDGQYIFSGTYELIGNEYVQVLFEGIAGAFSMLGGADTWKYNISGDAMSITAGGNSAILRRVR
jgi:hypothetical protein